MKNLHLHPQTGIYWYRKRVPDNLRETLGQREYKRSLGTRSLSVAKLACEKMNTEVTTNWRAISQGQRVITHKDERAIAGMFYKKVVEENEENPGEVTFVEGQVTKVILSRQVYSKHSHVLDVDFRREVTLVFH